MPILVYNGTMPPETTLKSGVFVSQEIEYDAIVDTVLAKLSNDDEFLDAVEREQQGRYINRIEVVTQASSCWKRAIVGTIRELHPHTPIDDNVMVTIEKVILLSLHIRGEEELLNVKPETLLALRLRS